ncbi:MAG: prepilin peptidase [Ferrimicrobium sp.]
MFEVVVAAIFGVLGGSTSAALIYRLRLDMPVAFDRSRCPGCHEVIRYYDNIPLLSYLVLRGHCRRCRAPIPLSYPIYELGGAGIAVASVMAVRPVLGATALGVALFGGLIAAGVDRTTYRIPNRVTYPAFVIVAALTLSDSIATSQPGVLIGALVASGALWLLFVGLRVVSRGGMGMGDAKLAALLGLGVGPLGLAAVIGTMIGAFGLGSIVGIVEVMRGRTTMKGRLAFGPFLTAGAMVVVVARVMGKL